MSFFRISTLAAIGIWASTAGLTSSAGRAHAAGINWNEYMQSSFVVGAIAAAMSRVEHCSKKPLLIEEIKDGNDKRTLVFTCAGTEEEEGSSILHLERFGDSLWMAKSFSFAG